MSQVTDNKLMKKHKCPVCGKKFETNRKDAKTCSPKCRQAMYRANPNPAKPKPVKKASSSQLGIVRTPQGLEFRYPQKILAGKEAERFIQAISIIMANTGISVDHFYDMRKLKGTRDDFITFSKLDAQKQKKIMDFALSTKYDIKSATNICNMQEFEKNANELWKKQQAERLKAQASQRR